jgi:hypothetical protein
VRVARAKGGEFILAIILVILAIILVILVILAIGTCWQLD